MDWEDDLDVRAGLGNQMKSFCMLHARASLGEPSPRPRAKGECMRNSPLTNPLGSVSPMPTVTTFGLGLEVVQRNLGGLSGPLKEMGLV